MDKKVKRFITKLESLVFTMNKMIAKKKGRVKNFARLVEDMPNIKMKGYIMMYLEDCLDTLDRRFEQLEDFRCYLKDFVDNYDRL